MARAVAFTAAALAAIAASGVGAQTPGNAAAAARKVTELVVRERETRRELRIVTSAPVRAGLSEPFHAADRTRLFLTLDSTGITENAIGDAADITKEGVFAGVVPVARDSALRLTLELRTLGRYGIETSGDTTIVWLDRTAEAAPANALVTAATSAAFTPLEPSSAATESAAVARTRPDAGQIARAGWAAMRRDAATALRAIGTVIVDGGSAVVTGASRAVTWVRGNSPLAEAVRIALLALLFLAPPLGVLLFFRRRGSSGSRAATDVPGDASGSARTTSAKPSLPKVTRRHEDARLWAARTLAANGADAAEITRQTGLSREAALLLIRRTKQQGGR